MPETDQHRRLIDLFRETGPAHHRAYLAAHGADPDWPLWYAEYTQQRLNQALGTTLTRSELTCLLVLVEKERMAGHMPAAPRM